MVFSTKLKVDQVRADFKAGKWHVDLASQALRQAEKSNKVTDWVLWCDVCQATQGFGQQELHKLINACPEDQLKSRHWHGA